MVTLRRDWDAGQKDTGDCMEGKATGTCSCGKTISETIHWAYGTSWDGSFERECTNMVFPTIYTITIKSIVQY